MKSGTTDVLFPVAAPASGRYEALININRMHGRKKWYFKVHIRNSLGYFNKWAVNLRKCHFHPCCLPDSRIRVYSASDFDPFCPPYQNVFHCTATFNSCIHVNSDWGWSSKFSFSTASFLPYLLVLSLQEAEPSSWNENHLPWAWLSAAWLRGWLWYPGISP